MRLPKFCRDAVTVKRPGTKTERGSEVQDWEAASEHVVHGCLVTVTASSGGLDGRQQSSETVTVLAPKGADIAKGDRLECRHGRFLVVGDPHAAESPTGALSHVRATASRWDG